MPARSGTSSSSMNTTASFGSSFMEGSPSRQSPSRHAHRASRSSITRDPYDSPSRQIAAEFNLRLSISDREFNDRLDQAAAERAKRHSELLAKAAEEHQKVLRGAELEVQRIALETEQARLRYEEAQRQEIERLRLAQIRQEAEAKRRLIEARQREEEAARQAAEQQKQIEDAEARRVQREREAAADKERKEKEEADRKAQEASSAAAAAAAATERARVQQASQPTLQPPQPSSAASAPAVIAPQGSANVEEIHTKYLALHSRMKEFRIAFANEHKQKSSPLKGPVGDTRRNVRLRLGQVNTDRKDSVAAIKKLREDSFNIALETPGPMIDIRPYIVSHAIPPLANEAEAQYPAFLLYIWICFEKFVLKQFEKEAAGADGRTIQEIGLITASLLSDQRYMWKGVPLTDILLAKLHRICPLLFGVQGTMATAEGRVRLGWLPIDKATPNDEQYGQRMRGLGAGYAALSLRSFAAKAPAVPMSEYWRAVVSICNTPSEHLWPGHFALLYGLIRDYYKKFISFYGVQARGVLRRALVDLPARAPPRCKDAAGTVSVLPLGWKKEGVSLE